MTLTQKIRRALNAGLAMPTDELPTPSPPLTLASAIYQIRPLHASHESMLMLLPEFIDAALEHESNASKFRALKRHLLICPRCVTQDLDLVETALLDAQHKITKPSTMPRPNLDFLKSREKGD
jgi:hypothetical protein